MVPAVIRDAAARAELAPVAEVALSLRAAVVALPGPSRRTAGAVVTSVVIYTRRWTRLPGTDFEVYLQGKSGTLTLHRDGGPVGGWSVPLDAVFIRLASNGKAPGVPGPR
jgi:hypothetical protein